MRIINETPRPTDRKFGELPRGAVALRCGSLVMKTDASSYNAVRLVDGKPFNMDDSALVHLVDCELTIKAYLP